MGLFSKKKKDEAPEEREPVRELDRSYYVQTSSAGKKESAAKKETKVKKTATEKKPAAEKKTAAKKEPAKKPAVRNETKTYHIVKNTEKNKWQVKATENDKATRLFNTKAEAEEYVKTLKANNQGARVVTHKKDGKFQKK